MNMHRYCFDTVWLPLILIIFLGIGCSGSSDHEGPVGTERMEYGKIYPGEEGHWQREATTEEHRADRNEGSRTGEELREGTPMAEPGTTDRSASDENAAQRDGKRRSTDNADRAGRNNVTHAERKARSDELRGMRGRLVDELEEVRGRLRDGTRTPKQKNEDQARAAALAQGLEQLDRTLDAIDASSDATWAEIKQRSDEEVKELRAWMERNEVGGNARR